MSESLGGRDFVTKSLANAEQKKRDEAAELDKLQAGKTTLGSLFKSKAKKESSMITLQAGQEIHD